MAKYTLNVRNETSSSQDFVIFQTDPDLERHDVMSLAWFSKSAHPTTELQFQWSLDYNLTWSNQNNLQPGVIFKSNNDWSSDFNDETKAINDSSDNSFSYLDRPLGVEVSGKPALALKNIPQMGIVFTSKPKYYITTGDYKEGEVLDISNMTSVQEIFFDPEQTKFTVTLDKDSTFTIDTAS